MKKLAFLLTGLTLTLSCSALQIKGLGYNPEKEVFLSSLKDISKTSEGQVRKELLLKTYRLMEALSKADSLVGIYFYKLQTMNTCSDSSKIDSLIEAFKKQKDLQTRPDTPDKNEWWEEMWGKRASYCDKYYRSPYYNQYWDLRAKPVLLHGIPDEEYDREETCWCDVPRPSPIPETCQIYYMHWISKGIFLALQDNDVDNHPDQFIPHKEYDRVKGMPLAKTESLLRQKSTEAKYITTAKVDYHPFEEVEKVLKASLHISSFPEMEGYNSTWISVGIPLEQFKSEPGGFDSLQIRAIIYEAQTQLAIIEDSGVYVRNLPANLSWIPVYGDYLLPDGKYKLVLTVKRTERQKGIYTVDFQLPSFGNRLVSDVLFSWLPVRNDTLSPWICRQGNIKIMDNPFSTFTTGDTIYTYFEFRTDNFNSDELGKYNYLISCRLFPLKEERKKPVVEMGPLQVVKDTAPIFILDDKKMKSLKESGYLIYSAGEKSGLSRDIFISPVQIPLKIPEGEYFLVVSVEDLNSKGRKGTLLAWRQIGIKK